jgi:hypothetical protein
MMRQRGPVKHRAIVHFDMAGRSRRFYCRKVCVFKIGTCEERKAFSRLTETGLPLFYVREDEHNILKKN